MDYQNLAVNYKKTNSYAGKLPDIDYSPTESSSFIDSIEDIESNTPDIGNLSYLNGEAAPSTSLIQEEKPKKKVRKVVTPTYRLPELKPSQRLSAFNVYYNQAISQDTTGQLAQRRNLFTRLANQESGFRHRIANSGGVPAFGYFQFMQGNYRGRNYNNVGQYAGVDVETFRNNPVLQIQAANNLANYFMRSFTKTELDRLHQMGYSDSAIIAGAWLGGPGGVRAYAFRGIDRKDANGTGVSKYMKMFNNL